MNLAELHCHSRSGDRSCYCRSFPEACWNGAGCRRHRRRLPRLDGCCSCGTRQALHRPRLSALPRPPHLLQVSGGCMRGWETRRTVVRLTTRAGVCSPDASCPPADSPPPLRLSAPLQPPSPPPPHTHRAAGIPHEEVPVIIGRKQQASPEFRGAVNPLGKVPAMQASGGGAGGVRAGAGADVVWCWCSCAAAALKGAEACECDSRGANILRLRPCPYQRCLHAPNLPTHLFHHNHPGSCLATCLPAFPCFPHGRRQTASACPRARASCATCAPRGAAPSPTTGTHRVS